MTNEEKQLLYKDLCGRLPYGVKVKFYSTEYPYGSEPVILTVDLLKDRWENIHDVKPYLRPMSNMTSKEKNDFEFFVLTNTSDTLDSIDWSNPQIFSRLSIVRDSSDFIDWLNEHHFDFRGLIQKEWSNQKGLAFEAPEDMYE